MNTATKPVSMARTAPRHVSAKDYSEFKVEGRHGKVDSRTRKQKRNNKSNWNQEA